MASYIFKVHSSSGLKVKKQSGCQGLKNKSRHQTYPRRNSKIIIIPPPNLLRPPTPQPKRQRNCRRHKRQEYCLVRVADVGVHLEPLQDGVVVVVVIRHDNLEMDPL